MVVDDQVISPPNGFLVRKALGNTDFDFGQTIRFRPALNISAPPTAAGSGSASKAMLKGSKSVGVLKPATAPSLPPPMSVMDYVLPTSPTGCKWMEPSQTHRKHHITHKSELIRCVCFGICCE